MVALLVRVTGPVKLVSRPRVNEPPMFRVLPRVRGAPAARMAPPLMVTGPVDRAALLVMSPAREPRRPIRWKPQVQFGAGAGEIGGRQPVVAEADGEHFEFLRLAVRRDAADAHRRVAGDRQPPTARAAVAVIVRRKRSWAAG
jgi:hypothetical protein